MSEKSLILTFKEGSSAMTVSIEVTSAQLLALHSWTSSLDCCELIHWLSPFRRAVFPSILAAILVRM